MDKLEEFKQNIEKYSEFIEGLSKPQGEFEIAKNSKYLSEIYSYLERESDFFRSAIKSYTSARKLMIKIKNLENLVNNKLNVIVENRKFQGENI